MAVLLRVSALALCAAFAAVLLRRSAPELGLPLSAVTAAVIFAAAVALLQGVRDLASAVHTDFGLSESYTLPMLKCLGIAVVTRLTGDLCRDASQSAAASAVELAGAACALGVILPLVSALLQTIGGLL